MLTHRAIMRLPESEPAGCRARACDRAATWEAIWRGGSPAGWRACTRKLCDHHAEAWADRYNVPASPYRDRAALLNACAGELVA